MMVVGSEEQTAPLSERKGKPNGIYNGVSLPCCMLVCPFPIAMTATIAWNIMLYLAESSAKALPF